MNIGQGLQPVFTEIWREIPDARPVERLRSDYRGRHRGGDRCNRRQDRRQGNWRCDWRSDPRLKIAGTNTRALTPGRWARQARLATLFAYSAKA